MAASLAALISKKSTRTAFSYRKKQNVSKYSWQGLEFIPTLDENEMPIFKETLGKYLVNEKTSSFFLSMPTKRESKLKIRVKSKVKSNNKANYIGLSDSNIYSSIIPF